MRFILPSLVFAISCTPSGLEPELASRADEAVALVGGERAVEGQFPSMAAVTEASSGFLLCAGTVVSSEWVLSSSFCLDTVAPGTSMAIEVGHPELGRGARYEVVEIIEQPNQDPMTGFADLVLMRVSGDLLTHASAAQLANADQDWDLTEPGQVLTLAGWGRTQPFVEGDGHLRYGDTEVPSFETCAAAFGASDSFCTADFVLEGVASCVADAGGPVMANTADGTVVVGIIGDYTLCNSGLPSLHTRVATHSAWIAQHVPDLNVPVEIEEPSGTSGSNLDYWTWVTDDTTVNDLWTFEIPEHLAGSDVIVTVLGGPVHAELISSSLEEVDADEGAFIQLVATLDAGTHYLEVRRPDFDGGPATYDVHLGLFEPL